MVPGFRYDFTITSIDDKGRVSLADGSFAQRAVLLVADVFDMDQLPGMAAVDAVEEHYRASCPEDHHRARLRLYRAARARLRELAVQAERDAD